VGDARATGRASVGETNLGALARASAGRAAVVTVGQFTHRGTVTAATAWGESSLARPARRPISSGCSSNASSTKDDALTPTPPYNALNPEAILFVFRSSIKKL